MEKYQGKLYRVVYNEEGIYNALKKKVDKNTWENLLANEKINWLPKPPAYNSQNKSYFTEKGYEKFKRTTLPLINEYLEKEQIKIIICPSMVEDVIYQDDDQIVVKKKPKTNKF